MPRKYRVQSELESLSTTNTSPAGVLSRISDMRKRVYGGRGGKFDQLKYLRSKGDGPNAGAEKKLSDAFFYFATGWIASPSKRSTQVSTEIFEAGSLE